METKKCCICHNTYEGFGNNPWPLMDTEDQCCDDCNKQVTAARIADYLLNGKTPSN